MSSLVSRRAGATTASVLLAAVALSGCSPFGGGGSKSTDISKLPNIPQGQKQQLVQQMQSASGDQKKQIAEKAVALNNMVGAQLVGVEPSLISSQQFKLDPKGQTVVNKNDTVYQMMSATDF
ncbi:putative lipoprotein, partial [Actinomyces sp. ICM54]